MVEMCELNLYLVDSGSFFSMLNPFHKCLWQWQAKATGPNGTYLAAWSSSFRAIGTKDYEAAGNARDASDKARDEIVSILLREGWVPMNARYFEQTFTRDSMPKS